MMTIKQKISNYLLAVAILFDCNVIYQYDVSNYGLYNKLWSLFIFACLIVAIVSQNRIYFHQIKKCVMVLILSLLWIALHFVIRPGEIGSVALFVEKVLFIIIYYYFVEKNFLKQQNSSGLSTLLLAFRDVVVLVAIVSLFFWLFASVFEIIPPTGQIYSNWTSDGTPKAVFSWLGLYFETQDVDSFGMNALTRNTAIFTEAPMASMTFCFALIIDAFIDKKRNNIKTFILILAIASTVSSTGYVFIICVFLFKYCLSNNKEGVGQKLKFFLLPILFIMSLVGAAYIFSDKLDTMSYILRADDYIVGFDAWQSNPLFGWGIGKKSILINYMDAWRALSGYWGFSNGIFTVLVEGGLYIGIFYFGAFAKSFILSIRNHDVQYFAEAFLVLYLFVLTVIFYNLILLVFLFRLWIYKNNE